MVTGKSQQAAEKQFGGALEGRVFRPVEEEKKNNYFVFLSRFTAGLKPRPST